MPGSVKQSATLVRISPPRSDRDLGREEGMAQFIVSVRPSCQDVIPAQAGIHAFTMTEAGSPFLRGWRLWVHPV